MPEWEVEDEDFACMGYIVQQVLSGTHRASHQGRQEGLREGLLPLVFQLADKAAHTPKVRGLYFRSLRRRQAHAQARAVRWLLLHPYCCWTEVYGRDGGPQCLAKADVEAGGRGGLPWQ